MKLSVNVFLTCIIYCDAEPGCHLNCLQAVGRFLSRISLCPCTFFPLRRHSVTSRKVYIFQETLYRFLQLSDRAYVSRTRCIDLVLFLVILAPHDDDSNYGSFFAHLCRTVKRVVYATVRLSSVKTMVSILYVDLISCRYF